MIGTVNPPTFDESSFASILSETTGVAVSVGSSISVSKIDVN